MLCVGVAAEVDVGNVFIFFLPLGNKSLLTLPSHSQSEWDTRELKEFGH